jgi:hypothetical protein
VCSSDNLDALTWYEEVFFYRLIVCCDDYGRMDARPAILRARLFPLKSVTDAQIEKALQSLRSAAMIDLYAVDGRSYLQMRTWERHQQVRAKRSKYPPPPGEPSESDIICNHMQADAPGIQSESVSESNPNAGDARAARFSPPTLEEVAAYCAERKNTVNAQRFVDHYTANGWRVGKNPMKDWRAAVRSWEQREKEGGFAPNPARAPLSGSEPMQRYTPAQRRETYAAATVDLDAID